MGYYNQGALAAHLLFKTANLFDSPVGRKLFSNTVQAVIDPEGKPRIIRTLEPYYQEFVDREPDPFKNFDERFSRPLF